ncbi:hypothetical protein AJ79_00443 [Helicocarpus griseus UAMH5409]|uniref:Uncharacterized protein n=1 Tax=Helicocarpus griseus UAMH5409 TaxID=1447875 RepID=A0A2B7YA29_9EURO|nr:hypothetical protein AJ79_00443 [Helicocarpus griseus UAMH5409]
MVSRTPLLPPPPSPDHTSPNAPRLRFSETAIHIFGYPTDQGDEVGVIAFENASAADFEFLSLDRTSINTPARFPEQNAENAFCTSLLSLGGRRWENINRFQHVLSAIAFDELILEDIQYGTITTPTSVERRWVSVAHPFWGGVCIPEIPRRLPELGDFDEQSPEEDIILDRRAILRLALNMDEKAKLLVEGFNGKLYKQWMRLKALSFARKISAAHKQNMDLAS